MFRLTRLVYLARPLAAPRAQAVRFASTTSLPRVRVTLKETTPAKKIVIKTASKVASKTTKPKAKLAKKPVKKVLKKKAVKKIVPKKVVPKKLPKKAEKAKIPGLGKRPLSGYMMFCNDARPKLDPSMKSNVVQQSKALSAQWKALSDAERAAYSQKAAGPKAEYTKQREEALRKLVKRPAGPYAIFFKENQGKYTAPADTPARQRVGAIARQVAEAWKNLTPSAKASYEDKAAKLKEEYEAKKKSPAPGMWFK
eukprot:TRINITY_DN224_c0_g1::TRINITY_DN224_c0_g1_i1::g.1680::m.1680 TRINITY_DN224_c0_g1::TRINITY_DN224_c0_g1_i1::g.1680  ORF type:complete len:268 (-),score=69.29,sp/P40618/HMGB3_CHICK/28.97/1e-09,HMG_box/PF00505.14/4.6e-12,HMG_box/PF00505.14/7.2e-12,HMG_box_2/PF09011.5/7.8e-10,HMG_box_2/PF09011.5/5.9e-06,KfrA_N/PF11740.3/1.7,KfrA_N/PF11740.3/3.9,Transpep_BrtH/PF14399.1/7,Transpep_BrtH/PF14399.1/23,TroA/PF01297.12/92,TroA/PF01297.12/1.1 TRINITY_DN224_c0_g1_i1:101-862(-)